MQFPESGKVFGSEDDLSRASSPPSLQQTRSACCTDNFDGGVSALGGNFPCAQRQILADDEGHGWRVMHRCHAPHQPQAIRSPMLLIR